MCKAEQSCKLGNEVYILRALKKLKETHIPNTQHKHTFQNLR